jgi:arylsulfatase A-like enzyme
MHIPLLFRQPGAIPAGSRCERMVSQYDWLPTLLSHLGLAKKMPKSPPSPGRDFAPILRGNIVPWDDVVFYEFEDTRAIRTADWKYIRRHPRGPHELYDLKRDPGETENLVEDPAHAETRQQLKARLDEFFTRYADPRYDLWRGGRSKARRLTRAANK